MSGLDAYLDVEERESRKIQPDNLRRLIHEILRHSGPLAGGFAMIGVATFAGLMEPRLFGYAIDEAIVPKRWDRLQELGALFFGVVCLRVIGTIGQGYLFELLGQRVMQDLRCQLFDHLQRLPLSVYDKNPAGRLLTRVTNDTAALGEMFSAGFVSMASNVLMVIGILGWMISMDAKLGLIASSVFPLLVIVSAYFSRKLKVSYREARSKLSALNAFLAENLLGMRVVHLFNRQALHFERFQRLNQWYADAQISTVRVFAFFQPSITLAQGLSMALIVWYGGMDAHSGRIPLGVLVAYFSFVLTLFQPVREIADKWNVFLSGMASAERIFSILSWPTELSRAESSEPAKRLAELRGHIVFENVWFAYEGEHWILKDFSLEILPGQKVGIVGHTGAGKTTLISLLMRFYEPQKGRILVDGKDIRSYDRRELRASIGIIQQDVFVFSGTFEDNVTFWGTSPEGDPLRQLGFSDELSARARSGAKLEERGSNLSMGEKQVLAFARTRAADPRIWILDEATANMDSATEERLQRALAESSRGLTAILIAHRLATVKTADLIVVLHKGVILEKGTHAELLGRDGLYARLYRYQASELLSGIPVAQPTA